MTDAVQPISDEELSNIVHMARDSRNRISNGEWIVALDDKRLAAERERDEARAQLESFSAALLKTRRALCGNIHNQDHIVEMAARIVSERDAAQAEARQLRVMLAHSYAGANLYRDDGELQDNSERPYIDFKRDSIDEIHRKLHERMVAALSAADAPRGQAADCPVTPAEGANPEGPQG